MVSPLYNDLTWKDGVEGETMGFPSLYKLIFNVVCKIGG